MNRRGMPSLVALLGLLAVAGYQNREKLSEFLRKRGGAPGQPDQQGGGLLEGLGGLLGGAGAGNILSGGLGDLVERFRQGGQGEAADSWVRKGPNQPITSGELERAIGPEVLATLSQQTGLSREELLTRLTRSLPKAVDDLTPEGRVPTENEAARLI
jgi:uncharacterized protein YidB (DUF937 family)